MGQKDIISKEILKNIARDISTHILHIDIKEDMEIIDKEFTRIESRDSDILKRLRELNDDVAYRNYLKMVNIYSSNRDLEKEVEKGMKMLTVDIEKTPLYKIGVERGIERGRVEEKLENAMIMIDKFKLSIDDIVREFNLKKEELLEYMEKNASKK